MTYTVYHKAGLEASYMIHPLRKDVYYNAGLGTSNYIVYDSSSAKGCLL